MPAPTQYQAYYLHQGQHGQQAEERHTNVHPRIQISYGGAKGPGISVHHLK